MRRFICVLALASVLRVAPALAAWIPVGAEGQESPPVVLVEKASPAGLSLRLDLSAVEIETVVQRGRKFAAIGWGDHGWSDVIGYPRVPVVRLLIEVPRGADVAVQGERLSVSSLALADTRAPYPPLPAQPPLVKMPGSADRTPFALDEKAYATDEPWPALPAVRVIGRGLLRGRDVITLEIVPLQIQTASRTLLVAKRIAVEVSFVGGDACASPPVPATLDPFATAIDVPLARPLACAGKRAGVDAGPGQGSTGGAEGMLVIVNDAFLASLDPFVAWKRQTGFRVEVVPTSSFGSSPTDAQIKSKIEDTYATWSDPPLGFVLLVGDTDFTPIHTGDGGGSSQVTDNWYACVDGADFLPDIAVARISTRTAAETADVVDKLLTYQRATFASDAWTKRAGFVGTSDSGHISLIEDTHDWCIETHYTPRGFEATPWTHGGTSCDRHYYTYDADTAEIAASIDAGRTVVNYSGHGSETSWQGPTSHGGYDQNDVRANSNDGMYPLVISNACVTGTLDRNECFGETWQKAPKKGAIAFVGASNNSYWDEDDYYQRRWHDQLFSPGGKRIGVLHNDAKLDLYAHYGDTGTIRYYFDMYNLLSEPSLFVWTSSPRDLGVSYPAEIPTGTDEFETVVMIDGAPFAGALVAARKDDENVFAAGYTDANGRVVLPLVPAPAMPGSLIVTVTGHDARPHEGLATVIPLDGAYLRYRAHAVDDSLSGCDADGVADLGETVTLRVTIENIGSETAVAATLALSSSSDVTLPFAPVVLGDVGAGASVTRDVAMTVNAGAGCREIAEFLLAIAWQGGEPRQDHFDEMLNGDTRDETDGEDFEHGGAEPDGWTHAALTGADDWALAGEAHGGSHAFHASGAALQKDVVLVTDVLHPRGPARLSFWHRYELTLERSGAFAEVSVEGSGTWTDLGPKLVEHPYDAEAGQGVDRRGVWAGSSGGWVLSSVDLSAYDGLSIRIRFRLGTVSGSGAGWWIDDVLVASSWQDCDAWLCGVPGQIRIDSVAWVDGRTVLGWEREPFSSSYGVRRATSFTGWESWLDVTGLDADVTDFSFTDDFQEPFAAWIVAGSGPDGEGAWGHGGH